MKGKSRPEMNERLGVVIICCLLSLDSESSYLHIGCSWNTSHLGGLLIRITAIAIPLHSSYKHFYYYYSISYYFPKACFLLHLIAIARSLSALCHRLAVSPLRLASASDSAPLFRSQRTVPLLRSCRIIPLVRS